MDASEVKRYIDGSAVPAVLTIIGDRWTLAIVRSVWQGVQRFDELLSALAIPRSTLAARLKHLIESGCVKKQAYSEQPPRYDYLLTEKGLALFETVVLASVWNSQWANVEPIQSEQVTQFIHLSCKHSITPLYACSSCKKSIDPSEIKSSDPAQPQAPFGMVRPKRSRGDSDLNAVNLRAEDILGDRWLSLIVACFFYGVKRYADIENLTGIAPNILASRLNLLLANELIEKRLYQSKPDRFEYRLTAKGKALFPLIVAMSWWGDHWVRPAYQASAKWVHGPCQQTLTPVLLCPVCQQRIEPAQLQLR